MKMWWLLDIALQTTAAVHGPGFESGTSHSGYTLKTDRVTGYTVRSQGREGNLPLRQKKEIIIRSQIHPLVCTENCHQKVIIMCI